MPKTRKPRPKNQREILDEALGNVVADPTSVGRSFPELENRGNDVSTKGDRVKDISISLIDIDTSIIKYIENKIKPSIIQDGNRLQVPVMYGFPERWQTIQEKGYLREYSGRFVAPVIVLKRDSMEANRTLGTKIDANRPQNIYAFETTYTKKNQYDNFAALSNRIPVKEFRMVVMPEYVTLRYSAVVFTNHLEQNNKIKDSYNELIKLKIENGKNNETDEKNTILDQELEKKLKKEELNRQLEYIKNKLLINKQLKLLID